MSCRRGRGGRYKLGRHRTGWDKLPFAEAIRGALDPLKAPSRALAFADI